MNIASLQHCIQGYVLHFMWMTKHFHRFGVLLVRVKFCFGNKFCAEYVLNFVSGINSVRSSCEILFRDKCLPAKIIDVSIWWTWWIVILWTVKMKIMLSSRCGWTKWWIIVMCRTVKLKNMLSSRSMYGTTQSGSGSGKVADNRWNYPEVSTVFNSRDTWCSNCSSCVLGFTSDSELNYVIFYR